MIYKYSGANIDNPKAPLSLAHSVTSETMWPFKVTQLFTPSHTHPVIHSFTAILLHPAHIIVSSQSWFFFASDISVVIIIIILHTHIHDHTCTLLHNAKILLWTFMHNGKDAKGQMSKSVVL